MEHYIYHSPVGQLLLTCNGDMLTGVYLSAQKQAEYAAQPFGDSPVLADTCCWLDDYFSGKTPDPTTLPLCPQGTAFQRRVWQELLQIPWGSTITYGQLAKSIAPNMSAQSVGQAVGKNPISIIIPCHRVIGTNNRLTGYAGGLSAKIWLLTHEGHDLQKFK